MDSSDSDQLLEPDIDVESGPADEGSIRAAVTLIPASVQRLRAAYNCSRSPARQQASNNLRVAAMAKWVFTTVFTGAGTFEGASSWTLNSVRKNFLDATDDAGCDYYYSTTDLSPTAKKAQRLHSKRTQADHWFDNVLDRLYKSDREELEEIASSVLNKFVDLKQGRKDSAFTKKEFLQRKRELSREMLFRLTSVLETCEFQEQVYCGRHKKLCSVHPASDPRYADAVWVEAGGNNCCPWSLIGSNSGWLDKATLPCLVWFYSTRFYEPRALIQECAPALDELPVKQALCFEPTSDIPKSIHSDSGSGQCIYAHKSKVFSTKQLGLQVSRKRLYAFYWRMLRSQQQSVPTFEDNFFQPPFVNASVYMVAPKKVIADEAASRLALNKTSCQSAASSSLQIASLNSGDAQRMEAWESYLEHHVYYTRDETKARDHAASKVWHATTKLCVGNISQDPEFYKYVGDVVYPAILPRSIYYDFYRSRVVTTLEMWLIHGWPHPGITSISDIADEWCPFPEALAHTTVEGPDTLSYREQRTLLGNGMHFQQIGVWFLQYLMTCDLSHEARLQSGDSF